ncbi:hypothetical protein P5673_027244 [Acropora cervicornis]|uniref:G-protein coupled receptors family 1 profile domain-containing protein n=1 Tax=Acropora cervicornis TaxID=6130 RepID=A0AAD9PZ94_ACRCE|nr:hypothetical protein P5673_027244 [Acropora cervicornis]
MAFADLMLGALALPLYIYHVGKDFKLWTADGNDSLEMLYRVVDTVCAQASIITATFIAVESNSLVNPILYSLRISEFRKALLSTARKIPKPSLSRLAAASTAVQLQVAFKDDIDLGVILRKKENEEGAEETEVQSSTREGSLKSKKSFSSDVNRS